LIKKESVEDKKRRLHIWRKSAGLADLLVAGGQGNGEMKNADDNCNGGQSKKRRRGNAAVNGDSQQRNRVLLY